MSGLLSTQPGLLDLSPSTLRARVESLGALLDVPGPAAAQLLLKHSALAAIPPNVTITRAKQMSAALRCSMSRAAELVAKVPPLLLLPTALLRPGDVGGARVDTLLDACATYEFYTGQWLIASARERSPARPTSFAAMHGGSGSA